MSQTYILCYFKISNNLLFRYKEAETVYEDLLKRNPENVMYYQKLVEAKQLSTPEDKVAFYDVYK